MRCYFLPVKWSLIAVSHWCWLTSVIFPLFYTKLLISYAQSWWDLWPKNINNNNISKKEKEICWFLKVLLLRCVLALETQVVFNSLIHLLHFYLVLEFLHLFEKRLNPIIFYTIEWSLIFLSWIKDIGRTCSS